MQRMASAFFLEREHFGDFLENHGRNDEPNAHLGHVLAHLVVGIPNICCREQDVLIGFLFFSGLFIEACEGNFNLEPLVGIVETNHLDEVRLGDLHNFEGANSLLLTNARHPGFRFGVIVSIEDKGLGGFYFGAFGIVADVFDLAGEPVFRHEAKVLPALRWAASVPNSTMNNSFTRGNSHSMFNKG